MIDALTLQHFLNIQGVTPGLVEDGDFGDRSFAGSKSVLYDNGVQVTAAWTKGRIYVAVEQLFLNKTMKAGLIVDGLAGPATNAALDAYAASALVVRHVWPKQSGVPEYFGPISHANQSYAQLPYTMFGDYARTIKVTRFECHEKVRASVERIFRRALAHYGLAEIRRLNLDIFSGCRVVRRITSGVGWSMHSWGIAIDIDAAHNDFSWHRNKAVMDNPDRAFFVQCWLDEGWLSLGRERDYDWMHFQATSGF